MRIATFALTAGLAAVARRAVVGRTPAGITFEQTLVKWAVGVLTVTTTATRQAVAAAVVGVADVGAC